jgi:hypothetical protein
VRNWLIMTTSRGQWRRKQNEIGMAEYHHGERIEREPVWGSEAEPPVGYRGKAPSDGQGAKPSIEANSMFVK